MGELKCCTADLCNKPKPVSSATETPKNGAVRTSKFVYEMIAISFFKIIFCLN